jgi:threonine synthase
MPWISTRDASRAVSFREALFAGLAPDGGLYLPERIEPLSSSTLASLEGRSLIDVATSVAAHLVDDEIPRASLTKLIGEALDFAIPLVPVGDSGTTALEVFHGPTFAFKDVGARVMARLMAHFVEPGDLLTVLVATSGDTGSAVAHAFAGVAGTRVVILYPRGQVSDVQEAQFSTLGGNVRAVAVEGTFDDCQAVVKAAFADASLRTTARLTSANSINVGRLLPQTFYYAWGALERPNGIWSVPSGNFGNLTAGLLARQLGFPIAHFIAATNINDVVPQYLATGNYAARRSVRTVANAMDVGAPSNFERIRHLYGNDLSRLRADVTGAAFDDAHVLSAITDVYDRFGYLLDPHSAVAWLGLDWSRRLKPSRDIDTGRTTAFAGADTPHVFVATAHPAKFREIVEPRIDGIVDLPQPLKDALELPRMITRVRPDVRELAELLR